MLEMIDKNFRLEEEAQGMGIESHPLVFSYYPTIKIMPLIIVKD